MGPDVPHPYVSTYCERLHYLLGPPFVVLTHFILVMSPLGTSSSIKGPTRCIVTWPLRGTLLLGPPALCNTEYTHNDDRGVTNLQVPRADTRASCRLAAGGGGLFCLERSGNCGLTSSELWLSRADMAKKGDCQVIISSQRVAVTVLNVTFLDQITVA